MNISVFHTVDFSAVLFQYLSINQECDRNVLFARAQNTVLDFAGQISAICEMFTEEKRGFDLVWDFLPHISGYQLRITGMAGYAAIVGGFMAIYPVFAQEMISIFLIFIFIPNFY